MGSIGSPSGCRSCRSPCDSPQARRRVSRSIAPMLTASRQGRFPSACQSFASIGVNIGGMCWTIRIGSGKSTGSPLTTTNSAFGPPVLVPITTIEGVIVSAPSKRGLTGAGGGGLKTPVPDIPDFFAFPQRFDQGNQLVGQLVDALRRAGRIRLGDAFGGSRANAFTVVSAPSCIKALAITTWTCRKFLQNQG